MTDLNTRKLARAYITEPSDQNAHALARAYVRGRAPEQTRKVLVSYGFGAGWSSWSSCDIATDIMLSHPAVIAALEAGEQLSETHPSIVAMVREIEAAGGDAPYLGGLKGLSVVSVEGPFSVEEYDGSESVRTMSCLRH